MVNFIKSLFGKSAQPKPNLVDGDIFYVKKNDQYGVFKILRVEAATLHVLIYSLVNFVPTMGDYENFEVLAWHALVSKDGLSKLKVIGNSAVSFDELKEYHIYLKDGGLLEAQISEAIRVYRRGIKLHDKSKLSEALRYYSMAIDLLPTFFEAIDNKGFCYMELGEWNSAVQCFENSCRVNDEGVIALFSIGECYMRLGDYEAALSWFDKAEKVDPSHEGVRQFRSLAEEKRPHPSWVS